MVAAHPQVALQQGARLPSDGAGLLVAAVDAQQRTAAVVLGGVPVAAAADGFQAAADAVQALLPQGLHVVGTYSSGSTPVSSWQPRSSKAAPPVVSVTGTGGIPVWTVNGQQQPAGLAAAPATAAAADDGDAALDVAAGFVPIRASLDVQLRIVCPAAAAATNGNAKQKQAAPVLPPPAAAVQAGVQQLQQQLLSQPERLVFAMQQQQGQVTLITAASSGTVQDVLSSSCSAEAPCVSVAPLQHTSQQSARAAPAPMFEFEPASQRQQQAVTLPLNLDVLIYAPASASLAAVHTSLLAPALQQQLGAVQAVLLECVAAGQGLEPVRAHHFKPPGLGFPVTVCYAVAAGPQEAAEAQLLPRRQQLHALLGLPNNRPVLRFANALAWSEAGGGEALPKAARLRNVHEALTPPGFGGKLYLVDGLYDYHHYMQDKFNDAGWGCAYRSLQTIVSWFRLQNYTSKLVPGHRQIQELLVSIGDKEAAFIGSSQWIGSFELSYILDTYLDVTCKTLAISAGSDIPSHARALAAHFTTQGTPVMIGGGVLAYTLLGVAWNEDTGEAAFLILDPHYTGGEDLKRVTQGGWVAWKQLGDTAAAGGPLFVKDAFYNFLMPQRPSTV